MKAVERFELFVYGPCGEYAMIRFAGDEYYWVPLVALDAEIPPLPGECRDRDEFFIWHAKFGATDYATGTPLRVREQWGQKTIAEAWAGREDKDCDEMIIGRKMNGTDDPVSLDYIDFNDAGFQARNEDGEFLGFEPEFSDDLYLVFDGKTYLVNDKYNRKSYAVNGSDLVFDRVMQWLGSSE